MAAALLPEDGQEWKHTEREAGTEAKRAAHFKSKPLVLLLLRFMATKRVVALDLHIDESVCCSLPKII